MIACLKSRLKWKCSSPSSPCAVLPRISFANAELFMLNLASATDRFALLNSYSRDLLDRTIPFWFPRCIDERNGGFLHCLDQDGSLLDTDKSVWAQGRMSWMLLTLYNTLKPNPDWLAWAESGLDFLRRFGFDRDGHMFFHLAQDGTPYASVATPIRKLSHRSPLLRISRQRKIHDRRNSQGRHSLTISTAISIHREWHPNLQSIAPQLDWPPNDRHCDGARTSVQFGTGSAMESMD